MTVPTAHQQGRTTRSTTALLAALTVAAVTATTLAATTAGAAPVPAVAGRAGSSGPSAGPLFAPRVKVPRWTFDSTAMTTADAARIVGADTAWSAGVSGLGVGVALVDTGVVPVAGLSSGNVVNGADLSFESQAPRLRYQDTFGHGTHLAGIIAGNDGVPGGFRGIAPDARLTAVKIGVANGAVDVSQALAAIDWVVAHRRDDPLHPIRVLDLAYGTDSTQGYQIDPLTAAVENAWRAGIVVVVAAGNSGSGAAALNDPADDPYVIAVGSADPGGTGDVRDDVVSDFTSLGSSTRGVDLVAPGRSVVSLRDPGSYIDVDYPGARVGTRFFKGSGTSQASAVVAGAAALLLQRHPDYTPDQVKAALTASTTWLKGSDPAAQGAGELNVAAALNLGKPSGRTQTWPRSSGLGSLEAARGSQHVWDGNVALTGENDLFGRFNSAAWAPRSANQTSWNGDGHWLGESWTGGCWCAASWSGASWSGASWSGASWSGASWSGRNWSGASWSGASWSGASWSGASWSGVSWSGASWSGTSPAGHPGATAGGVEAAEAAKVSGG